jgi:hypothetical protein
MRFLNALSLLSLLFYLPVYAEEVLPTVPEPTLQELIAQVKEAPNEQKRVLMNTLKIRLKSMNKESRQKTMIELKKSFSKQGEHPDAEHDKQSHSESSQHSRHQPTFRHLQQEGVRSVSESHIINQGGGSGHEGNGYK